MMKRFLAGLLFCLLGSQAFGALSGALRINSDTTGTNTTSAKVTVSGSTNLNAGDVIATNQVRTASLVATNGATVGDLTVNSNLTVNGSLSSGGSGAGAVTLTNASGTNFFRVIPNDSASGDVTLQGPTAAFAGLMKVSNSSGTMTPSAAAAGTDYSSPTSTETMQNKTIDAANNVLKFTDYKDFIYPARVDGAGCTIVTNDFASGLWGLATYSGSADTNGNYAVFRVGSVPYDLDSSATMTLKGFAVRVAGTDTDAAEFAIGLFSPATSSGFSASDFTGFTTFIHFDSGALTSPAANDIFYFADVTLTGWAAAVTAGRPLIIGIARREGTNDDDVTIVSGTIEYGRTK